MQIEVERVQKVSAVDAQKLEPLVFYGTHEQREQLEEEFPELSGMYRFHHEVIAPDEETEPKAQVGKLVGVGWDQIFYRFG